MKKNIEKSDAPTRMPTTLAPVRVRIRKIEKGTRGLRERSSITRKAAKRAKEPASSDRVLVDPQPAFSASTTAKTRSERAAVIETAAATSKARASSEAR